MAYRLHCGKGKNQLNFIFGSPTLLLFLHPSSFSGWYKVGDIGQTRKKGKVFYVSSFYFLFVLMWLLVSPSWASCKSGLCISTSICVPFGLSSLPASCKDLHIVPFSDSGVSPAWPLNTLFYLSSSRENPSIFLLKFLSLLASSF